MAELSEDPKQQAGWLTVAIVGAGPTGVEIAGQIRELAQRALGTSFRRIDPTKVRVVLLDAGHEPLSQFGDRLSEIASRELAAMGVELRMGVRVTAVDDEAVVVQSPAGVRADRRAHRDLGGRRAGIPGRGHARRRVRGDPGSRRTDRGQPGLHAPQSPRRVRDRRHGQPRQAPGRRRGGDATGATRRAGHSPFRRREARRPPAFKYRDLGSMATVGRFRAIVSLKGLRLSGLLGWLTWLVVHITFLTGFANRFSAMLHWTRSFFGRSRSQLAYSARFQRAHATGQSRAR